MYKEIRLASQSHTQFMDITGKVAQAVAESGIASGICCIFIPHTTAGVTINENADPSVVADMIRETGKIVPWEGNYKHGEGNSAAHIKASINQNYSR